MPSMLVVSERTLYCRMTLVAIIFLQSTNAPQASEQFTRRNHISALCVDVFQGPAKIPRFASNGNTGPLDDTARHMD